MKIAIGNDHRGVQLKRSLVAKFKGVTFIDVGSDSKERVDYPDFAKAVSEKVISGACERGILICSTGIGMSIAANKFRGIRAAMVWNPVVAEMTRLHNDSNILCLSGDYVEEETAFKILEVWLKTPFEGGRHQLRVDKINEIEAAEGSRRLKKKK